MATYSSPLVSGAVPTPTHGLAASLKVMRPTVTTTAALTTADSLRLFTMPKNSILQGFEVLASQMDTNGAPTLAFNIGDAGLATRMFTAVPVGRVVTPLVKNETDATANPVGVGYQFPADTLIVAVPSANAATGVAGTFTLSVFYSLAGGAS
jgi:hypothetical protein